MALSQLSLTRLALQPSGVLSAGGTHACYGRFLAAALSLQQVQPCSSSAASTPSTSENPPAGSPRGLASPPGAAQTPAGPGTQSGEHDVIYKGHFSRALKRLKQASLLNTFASLTAAPFIIQYSEVSPLARVAVAASMVGFGLLTTSALHWFTSSYCHELRCNKESGDVTATTLSILARMRHSHFNLSDVVFPDSLKPMSMFKAKGRIYYVDKNTFPDQDLLEKLTPPHPAAQEMELAMRQQADMYGQQSYVREAGQGQHQDEQEQQAQQGPQDGGAEGAPKERRP